MSDDNKQSGGGLNRRELLSFGAAAGLVAGTGAGAPPQAAAQSAASFPTVPVAALSDLEPGAELSFEYPDENAPCVLLRLDGPVEGGVGPDQSIVAYSMLCTHKGCPVAYHADQKMLICPCHWSSFDPAKRGRMIIGQASQSLPQITLRVEAGMVEAVGIDGLIYGRHTNIL